jgi:alkylation response protein AidB-like acyl-CoA dehydrogenase
MDFALTDEQQALRDEARRWLAGRYPAEEWNEADWAELAELGWLGVATPEECGGAGLSFLEEAVLHEELGRALYPGPFLATVALALPQLPPEEAEQAASGARRWSAQVGTLVPYLDRVDAVAVDGRLLEPDGYMLESIDETRPVGSVRGADEPATAALVRARAALACECVGVAERALELGLEHARTREQFGRPIGAYQAVAHKLADTYREVELARSLAYWAAWAVAEGDEQAPVAAASAKAFCAEAAVAACERSIQVHGGTGFTWEHVLHRYYKRALWNRQFAGTPAECRAVVAAAVI